MATKTKRRSLLSRLFRFLTRRKTPNRDWRPPGGGGNAGVREPRRPNPAPPALSAAVDD